MTVYLISTPIRLILEYAQEPANENTPAQPLSETDLYKRIAAVFSTVKKSLLDVNVFEAFFKDSGFALSTVAHVAGIPDNPQDKKYKYEGMGNIQRTKLRHYIFYIINQKGLEISLSSKDIEIFRDAAQLDDIDLNNPIALQNTLVAIKKLKLTFIPTGWKSHQSYLVFYHNYMAVCGTDFYLRIFQIAVENFNSEVLSSIIDCRQKDQTAGHQFLNKDMPRRLAPSSSSSSLRINLNIKSLNTILTSPVGNCSYKSLHIAILAAQMFSLSAEIKNDIKKMTSCIANISNKLHWALLTTLANDTIPYYPYVARDVYLRKRLDPLVQEAFENLKNSNNSSINLSE